MRKTIAAGCAALTLVGMLAMPAAANTTRAANCEALGGTYALGYHPTKPGELRPAHDRCLDVPRLGAPVYGEWEEVSRASVAVGDVFTTNEYVSSDRVNSDNAAQDVYRVTYDVQSWQLFKDVVRLERTVTTRVELLTLHAQGNDRWNLPSGKVTGATEQVDVEVDFDETEPVAELVGTTRTTCMENPGSSDRENACPDF
ncbi:hypothetical protein [Egicoccus sp. AB-alg2]|uniref:hypothetical protein n=1 Tax=Egicoccus sp. AB-alg2 TaxID=3242693 RepID=UPI00359CEB0B